MAVPVQINSKTSASIVQDYMNIAVEKVLWNNTTFDGRWKNFLVRLFCFSVNIYSTF
jgi:hypothetical protein